MVIIISYLSHRVVHSCFLFLSFNFDILFFTLFSYLYFRNISFHFVRSWSFNCLSHSFSNLFTINIKKLSFLRICHSLLSLSLWLYGLMCAKYAFVINRSIEFTFFYYFISFTIYFTKMFYIRNGMEICKVGFEFELL